MDVETVAKLSRDLKRASKTLGRDEARFLVDTYYMMQKSRIRSGNQVKALSETKEPHDAIAFFGQQFDVVERNIKNALAAYSQASVIGQWAESIKGIGPIISAGLLAHIDMNVAKNVSQIWRFAGLDPTVVWNKGEKRPWNASLKTLCWKIGHSFVLVSSNDDAYYGKVYLARKLYEEQKNESGQFAEIAKWELANKKYDKKTDAFKAYSAGLLPKARIVARAQRYAAKLFLSHWHWVAYETTYGQAPPKPYVIAILGHCDMLKPPNWPMA